MVEFGHRAGCLPHLLQQRGAQWAQVGGQRGGTLGELGGVGGHMLGR